MPSSYGGRKKKQPWGVGVVRGGGRGVFVLGGRRPMGSGPSFGLCPYSGLWSVRQPPRKVAAAAPTAALRALSGGLCGRLSVFVAAAERHAPSTA